MNMTSAKGYVSVNRTKRFITHMLSTKATQWWYCWYYYITYLPEI